MSEEGTGAQEDALLLLTPHPDLRTVPLRPQKPTLAIYPPSFLLLALTQTNPETQNAWGRGKMVQGDGNSWSRNPGTQLQAGRVVMASSHPMEQKT